MIVNQTKNDLELNARASVHISKKARILFFITSLILIACGVLIVCLEYFTPTDESDYFFGIFLIAFGAVFLVFDLFFYPMLLKYVNKKYMQGKYSDCRYTFTEEGYTIESNLTEGEATSTTQGSYDAVTQLHEYSDMWLIYFNKVTLFALKKDGMITGTADDLSALLRSVLGSRYKSHCKKK